MARDWNRVQEALPSKPENIVITGPACSGKSTLARGLLSALTDDGKRVLVTQNPNWERSVGHDAPDILIWDCVPPTWVSRSLLTRYVMTSVII